MSLRRVDKYICVASGPSLTQEQLDYIKEHRTNHKVVVINDNYRLAPWADAHYACDGKWWNKYHTDVKKNYKGVSFTQCKRSAANYNLNLIEGEHKKGLGKDNKIHFGSNSGYQAINLCYLWGAKEIMLIGYDMKLAPDGTHHWFGNHPGTLHTNSPYEQFARNFINLAEDLTNEGINVVNCTKSTALTCFKKQTLEEYFKQ